MQTAYVEFTHPTAPRFRALCKPETLAKLAAWFSKTPAQMTRAATVKRGKVSPSYGMVGETTADALRAGVQAYRMGTRSFRTRELCRGMKLDSRTESKRPAAELAQELARAPHSDMQFWAYCWAYASAREGLDVFPDDETTELADEA